MRATPTVALLFVSLLAPGPRTTAVSPTEAKPTVELQSTSVRPGQRLRVSGAGWTPGDLLRVEICGNGALDATADCDVVNSVDAGVQPSGAFGAQVEVTRPPTPCPCVVRVSTPDDPVPTTTRLTLIGVPEAPPKQRVQPADLARSVEITDLRIDGAGPWTSWLGASPARTIRFTVTNASSITVRDLPVRVTVGRGDDPTGIVDTPTVESLAPGETVDIEAPIEVDVPAFGRYTARVELGGTVAPVVLRAHTTTYPWVLIGLLLVAVQCLLVMVRNRLRARVLGAPAHLGASADDIPAAVVAASSNGSGAHADTVDLRDPAEEKAMADTAGIAARTADRLAGAGQVIDTMHSESTAVLDHTRAAALHEVAAMVRTSVVEADDVRLQVGVQRREAVSALQEVLELRDAVLTAAEGAVAHAAERVSLAADEVASVLAAARSTAEAVLAEATERSRELLAVAQAGRDEALSELAGARMATSELVAAVQHRAAELDEQLASDAAARLSSALERGSAALEAMDRSIEELQRRADDSTVTLLLSATQELARNELLRGHPR